MATVDKLIVRIDADLKNLKRGLRASEVATKKTSAKMSRNFAQIRRGVGNLSGAIFSLKGALLGLGVGAALKSLISVGDEVESLQIRFKTLFGSAAEGAKAFDIMAKFASKVPFSLKQIQAGSGSLLAVADDAEDLGELLEMTGTIAAATGLDFKSASEQIQRSLSAGIGAADLFRDRGVTAMLGFKAGVKVSVNDTRIALEKFAEANKGITDELAGTFKGTLSMIGDSIFTFQRQINDAGFFTSLTARFKNLKATLDGNKEASAELAKTISDKLISAMDRLQEAIDFVRRNWDELILAIKIFIGFKLASMVFPALIGGFGLLKIAIGGVSKAVVFLNTVTKANVFLFALGSALAGITFIINKQARALDELDKKWERLSNRALKEAQNRYAALAREIIQLKKDLLGPGIFGNEEAEADMQASIDRIIEMRAKMLQEIGPALIYNKDNDVALQSTKALIKTNKENLVVLSDIEKEQIKQEEVMDRLIAAEDEKLKILGMTKAEEMLYKALKQESVKLTKYQTDSILNSIQATLDLNKELEIQKAILAENASNANAIFKALSEASEIEKKDPQKRSFSERTTGLGPLDKFMYPEFKPVGTEEDEAKLLEELGILTKNYREEFLLLDQALQAGRITQEEYNESIGVLRIRMLEANETTAIFMEALGRTTDALADTMADALMGMGEGWKGFRNTMKQIIRDIIRDLIKLQYQQLITKAMGSSTGGNIFGAIAGFFGGSSGGAGGSYTGYGVKGEHGRTGLSSGSPLVVGEAGPELFVPHTGGSVFSNRQSKAMGGGSGVVVNQTINIETGVSQTVRAEMKNLLPLIEQSTIGALLDAKQRGGQVAEILK